jgi:integrase
VAGAPAAPRSGAALIISKWAGHYDAAFTMRTYVHASDADLKEGTRTLARLHKIA